MAVFLTEVKAGVEMKSSDVALPDRIPVSLRVSVLMLAMSGLMAWFYLNPPDMGLISRQEVAIQIHLGAAVLAFVLGLILLVGPKGILPHRLFGWVWVGLMLTTALSSFFIREINDGHFSLIHALSGWTTIAAPMLIWLARRKQIKRHRLSAYGLYFGGGGDCGPVHFYPRSFDVAGVFKLKNAMQL